MKRQRPLGQTIRFLFCFFYLSMAWADKTDLASTIKVNPLPTLQTTATTKPAPAPLVADPQINEITERLRKSVQRLKQAHTAKSAGRSPAHSRLAKNTNGKPPQEIKVSSRADGSVRQMKGGILESPAANQNARSKNQRNDLTARNFLRRQRYILGIKNPDEELYLLKQNSDELGRDHLKYGQRYRGLAVWPADIIVHIAPQGHVDLMNGSYAPTPRKPLVITPRVNAIQAQETALNSLAPFKSSTAEAPELIFYYSQHSHQLAWKMKVNAGIEARWIFVIDAISGDILLKYNEIMEAASAGSGIDLFNQTQSLQLFEQNDSFFMLDTSKEMFDPSSTPPNPNTTRGGIFLLDAQNQEADSFFFNPSLVSSPQEHSGFLPDAVSAAFNISQVYDYYLERHQRNSIDNKGGSLFGIVRVGQNFDNAFWDGERMYFGDGAPYAAALDIVAHEVSHGITQRSSNLIYQGQSGALNEAFSDIFGEMVEARTYGNDWVLGAILLPEGLRNLRDPSSVMIPGLNRPYPAKMSDFIFIAEDNGGVHLNSSIINHAYYLLAEGLDNAIGLRDAEQIFYRALTVHLVRNSQFIDARLAAITSADELFGVDSIQSQKTAEAFERVEVLDNIASTPPPPSTTAISGPDLTLFICFDPALGANFLCRRDASLGDNPALGDYLSRFDVLPSRPSVSGDGSTAVFVDSINDICLIRTDLDINVQPSELCLGLPGTVSSVSISPDGKLFGFIMLGANGQPQNFITVINIDNENAIPRTFELVAPAIDASTINHIAFADVMNFTLDGRLIIYDALTEFNLLDGTAINNWSIYALDITTGQTFVLISAIPGLDISNPSLSHTSDNFMTFALSETGGFSSSIVTANLNTGDIEEVGLAGGVFSIPGYNGDDSAVIFDQVDQAAATGFSLIRQALNDDHLTARGSADLWLFDAVYGVIYRRGEFQGLIEETALYDSRTQILQIHAVDVPNNSGGVTTYAANLSLTSFQPLRLHVISASLNNETRDGGNAFFNPDTGKVSIPKVSITDANSNTQFYRVEMNLISNALDFEVSTLELIH
ncbi:MAG: hypothetical protein GQ583_02815 [Methyloprofundus sp.]|nr:hypothetical protein [Methyloprofundus sp.]